MKTLAQTVLSTLIQGFMTALKEGKALSAKEIETGGMVAEALVHLYNAQRQDGLRSVDEPLGPSAADAAFRQGLVKGFHAEGVLVDLAQEWPEAEAWGHWPASMGAHLAECHGQVEAIRHVDAMAQEVE